MFWRVITKSIMLKIGKSQREHVISVRHNLGPSILWKNGRSFDFRPAFVEEIFSSELRSGHLTVRRIRYP